MDDAVLLSMAQMLGVQLRPEAVRKLVPDAEYTLRELICLAKTFMRHAKRNRLTQDDVTFATKLFDSMLNRRNKSERFLLLNDRVRHPVSNLKKLTDLYKSPLPPHRTEVSLHSLWLVEKLRQDEGSGSLNIIAPTADEKSSPQAPHQNGGLMLPQDDPRYTQRRLEHAVTDLISLVNTHVTPAGKPDVLIATTHAVASLLTQDFFETEKHRDDLLRCALTCIMGNYPRLNTSDSWQARQRVILALAKWKHETTDVIAVGRVCKTLFAAALDPTIPLDALCGAITAIVAFGETIYLRYLTPHIPALLHNLENRLGEKISRSGEDTRTTVDRICQILSRTIEALTPAT